MRVAIVGCGNQGLGFAASLVTEDGPVSVRLLDREERAVERAAVLVRSRAGAAAEIHAGLVDATEVASLASAVEGCDIVLNATLPELNQAVMSACVETGAHYLDLYAHDDAADADPGTTLSSQVARDREFAAAGLIAVPSVGVNPGWVHLAALRLLGDFDEVDAVNIREIEWIDSDDPLCSGPPELLAELFLGEPGPLRVRNGRLESLELLASAESYAFPDPVGRQTVLGTTGVATSVQIQTECPLPIGALEEKFAVLSAGRSMPELLLGALARQTASGEVVGNVFTLVGRGFTPTTDLDLADAHRSGAVRDAAWVSAVEVVGRSGGQRNRRTTTLIATLSDALRAVPWAPPGVLATTALPVEVALAIGRGEIEERGVVPAWRLADAASLFDRSSRRGVTVLEGSDRTEEATSPRREEESMSTQHLDLGRLEPSVANRPGDLTPRGGGQA